MFVFVRVWLKNILFFFHPSLLRSCSAIVVLLAKNSGFSNDNAFAGRSRRRPAGFHGQHHVPAWQHRAEHLFNKIIGPERESEWARTRVTQVRYSSKACLCGYLVKVLCTIDSGHAYIRTTWRPSRWGVLAVVMKNCDPLLLGPALAIDKTPGLSCFKSEWNSSGNL